MIFLYLSKEYTLGVKSMMAKILMASALIAVMGMTLQGAAQADPLGTGYTIPVDLRRTSSLGDNKPIVFFDPQADPLGIDPLMRPLDPEHTWEYLDRISGRAYLSPYIAPETDLRGRWALSLTGGMPGQADLMLLQDRNVILGRGTLASGGSTLTATASGQISVDVLYLDLVSLEDLKLYRLTLTIGQDSLSGSYNAFDGLGRTWSGSVSGSRSA
jgi:hypothetical protein